MDTMAVPIFAAALAVASSPARGSNIRLRDLISSKMESVKHTNLKTEERIPNQ